LVRSLMTSNRCASQNRYGNTDRGWHGGLPYAGIIRIRY
jgi:hypothetical protein